MNLRGLRWALLAAAALESSSGCGPSTPAAASSAAQARQTAAPSAHGALPPPGGVAPASGAEVSIPAGRMPLGSRPGTPFRNPALEADLAPVELAAFAIDALPFPNAPDLPARTGVSRDEADALCRAAGKHLCTELQWERACKGAAATTFVTGEALDLERCRAKPSSCKSSEGVLGLGIALREWTSSEAGGLPDHAQRTAVVRGAPLQAPAHAHRCAARTFASPDSRTEDLGFRCCRGPTDTATYPAEPDRPFTRALSLDAATARAALARVPELAAFATSFTPFTDADADAALRRGRASRTGITLWQFLSSSTAWSPTRGEELHVLTGRTDQGALLAVLHAHGDGRLVHGASAVIAEPDATLAVGGSTEHPRQLIFTTCYGCPGEGGTIRFGDDARVELLYR